MKKIIDNTRFTFKEARLPRKRQVSRRLQALSGEATDTNAPINITDNVKDHHRVSTYYLGLDKVLSEMKSRFDGNDQDVLCGLGDIVLNTKPSDESYELIASHYGDDKYLLQAEKNIFMKLWRSKKYLQA